MKVKMLVVDDEKDLLSLIVENLISDGIDAVGADNVEDALALSKDCTHAMIDGLNGKGYPLAKELRSRGVVTFSFSGNNKINDSEQDGYDGLINKPFPMCNIWELLNISKAA